MLEEPKLVVGMVGLLVDRFLGPRILLCDRIPYAHPRELGLALEEVEIPRAGGRTISGWWAPGPPGAPAVLFCPGNSGNLSGHLAYLELVSRAGLGVLGFDYSGFGRSGGRPALHSLVGDALAALDALSLRAGLGGRTGGGASVAGRRLGVFGISLGANVALEVAARRSEVAAVAVEGLSIQREVVRGILCQGAIGPLWIQAVREGGAPPAPRLRHRIVREGATRRFSAPFTRAPFLETLPRIAELCFPFPGKDPRRAADRLRDRPVFIIHGAQDLLLPFEAALEVRRALRGPSRLWLIPEAGHAQEPALLCDDEYSSQLGSFFHGERAGVEEPAVSFRSRPRAGGYRLELELEGPPGPYLVAVVAGLDLVFLRLWADGREETRGRAEAAFDLSAPAEEAHAIRYHHAERRGGSWEPRVGERARCFARVGGALRRASAALIEHRLPDADRALEELDREELPPAFDLARRLHHSRRAALGAAARPRAILSWALCALLLTSCSGRPSPFPPLGPLSEEETLQVLDRRARTVRSLYAVVRISIDSHDLSGTFDVVSHYMAPAHLRMSAFKEVLLDSRTIFDLVFAGNRYAVEVHGEEESESRRGALEDFPDEMPRMAAIYWLREALFLPGQDPVRVIDPGRREGLGRVEGEAEPGGYVEWQFDPVTLEVKRGLLRPKGRAEPFILRFGDYRLSGGAFIPGEIVVEDPEGHFGMRGILRDLEVNPPVDPSVFQLEPLAAMEREEP